MQAFYDAVHGPQITITVGSDVESERTKIFRIPTSLLITYDWFAKALEPSHFKEGGTNSITLADDLTHAFTAFHYYLFHKDLTFPDPPKAAGDGGQSGSRQRYVQKLCEIWVFGDKYGIPGMQNCAMFKL
ncbi:hypothetical protein LTR85_007363 [Meristemomyces frigidus]|nr:hypothetical protein LTR85_007363 [Meristemomyces frigidus]